MHDADDEPLAQLAVARLPANEVEKARPAQFVDSAAVVELGDGARRVAR